MNLKTVLLIFIFFTTTLSISAENICGIVYSMTTVEPLQNVTIRIQDKDIELKSDANGDYCLEDIKAVLTDTIVFSYTGYNTIKVAVNELQRRECKSIFLTQ